MDQSANDEDSEQMEKDDLILEINDDEGETPVEEICRLCGKESFNYLPIFGGNTFIAEKISKCLPIIVHSSDELPSNICKRCLHYLNISYKLVVNSVKVDAMLREKLKQSNSANSPTAKMHTTNSQKAQTLIPKSKANVSMKTLKATAESGPMICEMCNTLFLDMNAFDSHIKNFHLLTYSCNLCDSSFATSEELINHKTINHQGNISLCKPCVQKDKKNDPKLLIPQFIPATPINLVPLVSNPAKKAPTKSVPNIIRNRKSSSPKFVIPTNKNPIKLIPATPINFQNNLLSMTPSSGEPLKLLSLNSSILPKSNLKILPATNIPSSGAIKILTNPLVSLNSTVTTQTLTNNSRTLKILNPNIPSSSSTLTLIPTDIPGANHIAVPANAKVAIPRITSSNVKETKPKVKRGPRPKKNPEKVQSKEDDNCKIEDDHNYTNNDYSHYDDNDSDDSCNLPLQPAPTVHVSTCAYDVQCDVCGIGVDDDELMEVHKKIHLPQKMGCKECHMECDSLYELYMHKKRSHNVYKRVALKFSCEQCGKFFTNSWQWESHEELKCKKKFPMYPCKYCEMGFSTNHKLKRHLRKHKKEMLDDPEVPVFKCVACPKVFVDEEFYQKHRNVHDPECWDKYKCHLCNRSFRDNVRLKEHQQSIHEGIKPHQCDVCGRTFHRRSNMKVHREKHFARKCEHCDESFLKLSELISHIQEVHKVEPSRRILAKRQYKSGCYVCRFCGKKLSTNQSVIDHERIHTGEKPHECKTCGKTFRSYTARWAHVQRHKKGSFTCEHCGKVFSYKQNLLTHILIHMPVEDRKHQCPKCGKKFLRKGHLNIHMRIHNGERPYTCDICNFSFTQMGDMRRHRARHSSNYIKTRKSRIKVVSELPDDEVQNIIDISNPDDMQQIQIIEAQDIEEGQELEVHDIEVIHELQDVDGKHITVIQRAEDLEECEEVEVEEINQDLEYQINFIMNEEEPAGEIVIA